MNEPLVTEFFRSTPEYKEIRVHGSFTCELCAYPMEYKCMECKEQYQQLTNVGSGEDHYCGYYVQQ